MGGDQLPSWRETAAKQSIAEFVAAVTSPESADFVAPPERIAVFDNDGTLWTEQPVYAQLAFALDRAAELGHPVSLEQLRAGGMPTLVDLVKLTHAGITTDEFEASCRRWLAAARHPPFGRPYPAMVYQPMLELLALLGRHGFSCWIFSGGGTDFMRAFASEVYGLPPHRVIGSVGAPSSGSARGGPSWSRATRSRSSTTGRRNRARSTLTSGSARSWRPGTPTGTWPCSSGPLPAPGGPCSWSYSTPTPSGSTSTTVTPSWAAAPSSYSPPPSSTTGP